MKLKIPYGVTSFEKIRTQGYYFIDKTKYIEVLENYPSQYLTFLRPRKFGKSLFISMLEYYYDIAHKDKFDRLFGGTYIHKNPTPLRNSYLIFKLSLSGIPVSQSLSEVQKKFADYIQNRFRLFLYRYGLYEQYEKYFDQELYPEYVLDLLVESSLRTGKKILLLIDEYDNFLNEILVNYGQQSYIEITHGTGFIREFFKKVKDMTQEFVIDRIFITGVSPMVMNDVTSGYNIGKNISVEPLFTQMLGVTDQQLRQIIQYYVSDETKQQEIYEDIKLWYNGYSFDPDNTDDKLYNTTLIWYYLSSVVMTGRPPRNLLDSNLMTDFGKLRFLVYMDNRLNGNFSILRKVLEEGEITVMFQENFYLGRQPQDFDSNAFASLLFYLGLLTFKGYRAPYYLLQIPNLTTEELFWSYLRQGLQLQYHQLRIDTTYLLESFTKMAYSGEWREAFEYIIDKFYEVASIRDFIFREQGIKMFFMAYLQMSGMYILRSESEQSQGYADIYLEPKYADIKYRYLIEFKYVKKEELKQGKEKVIKEFLKRAVEQLKRYRERLAGTNYKCVVIIASSNELLYMDEIKN